MKQHERLGKACYVCETCSKNKEDEDREREAAATELAARKAREARVSKQLRECNIGDRFKGMTFPDYKPACEKAAKVLLECQSYVDNFQEKSGANVLMIGSLSPAF
jgi:DNA replication protein DnaC